MEQAKGTLPERSVILVKGRKIIRPLHSPFPLHALGPESLSSQRPILSPHLLEPMEPDSLTSEGPNRWKNIAGEVFVSLRLPPTDNFVIILKDGEEKPWVAANVANGVYSTDSTFVQIGQMYPWGINDPLKINELDKLAGRTGRGFYGVFLAHAILFALKMGIKEIAIVSPSIILGIYYSNHLIEPGGAPQMSYSYPNSTRVLWKYTLS